MSPTKVLVHIALLAPAILHAKEQSSGAPPLSDFAISVTFGPVMDTRNGAIYMSGSNTTSGRTGGTGPVLRQDGGNNPTVSFDLQSQAGASSRALSRAPIRCGTNAASHVTATGEL